MKNSMLLFLLITFSLQIYAQENHFPQLKKVVMDADMDVYVKYDASKSTLIQKKRSALPVNNPFRSNDEYDADDILVLETCLEADCFEKYLVFYTPGMSADPAFYIFNKSNPDSAIIGIGALHLYITSNGFFYIDGHTNNTFNTRQKFRIQKDEVKEVRQPFYYVGLKSKTKIPLTLYSDENMTKEVAKLSAGSSIEVLLADPAEYFRYLVKTSFGLVGWVEFEMVYLDDQIEGLFFKGD